MNNKNIWTEMQHQREGPFGRQLFSSEKMPLLVAVKKYCSLYSVALQSKSISRSCQDNRWCLKIFSHFFPPISLIILNLKLPPSSSSTLRLNSNGEFVPFCQYIVAYCSWYLLENIALKNYTNISYFVRTWSRINAITSASWTRSDIQYLTEISSRFLEKKNKTKTEQQQRDSKESFQKSTQGILSK